MGAALDLVPLVGRVVRDRVGELVEEGRDGLAKTLRDVKQQLEQEIGEREADGDNASAARADAAVHDEPAAAHTEHGSRVAPPRS